MKRFEKILPNLRVMALVKEGCIPYGQAYGFITLTFSKQAFNESLDFFCNLSLPHESHKFDSQLPSSLGPCNVL